MAEATSSNLHRVLRDLDSRKQDDRGRALQESPALAAETIRRTDSAEINTGGNPPRSRRVRSRSDVRPDSAGALRGEAGHEAPRVFRSPFRRPNSATCFSKASREIVTAQSPCGLDVTHPQTVRSAPVPARSGGMPLTGFFEIASAALAGQASTRCAVVGRHDLPSPDEELTCGRSHRGNGSRGRIAPGPGLAGLSGDQVVMPTANPEGSLTDGEGSRGDRLSLERRGAPGGVQLFFHHPGQIRLHREIADHVELGSPLGVTNRLDLDGPQQSTAFELDSGLVSIHPHHRDRSRGLEHRRTAAASGRPPNRPSCRGATQSHGSPTRPSGEIGSRRGDPEPLPRRSEVHLLKSSGHLRP